MVKKLVKPKNDVKKPVCRITGRMKVGKGEAETGKEPPETEVTSLRVGRPYRAAAKAAVA